MKVRDTEEMQTKKKNGKGKLLSSDNSTDEDDVDQLEVLLARRFHRNTKVSFLSFVSIVMKLVILQKDTHKRRITKKEESTRTREKIVMKIIKTKAKDATLLKKILMRMMMK